MEIVNIEEAKKEFIRYADDYDLTNDHINRKKYHSLRVMEISNFLAREENFTEEENQIATIIGLLHDIARFKQYTEYQTFRDKDSFDHGDMAVQILEKDNYLRKYIKTEKYDEIIELAIKNHNKFAIEEGLTEEQKKFCKIIRDADKIDILFQATSLMWKNETSEMENSKLNPDIIRDFYEKNALEYKNYKKMDYADKIIQFLVYVFDFNYKSSFRMLEEQKYIDDLVGRFNFKDEYTKKTIAEAGEKVKQYIIDKIQ